MDAYQRARTVSVHQIATEMGWTYDRTVSRLWTQHWLVKSLRRGTKYDAGVIDVLQKLYGLGVEQPRDFLADYLKEI